MLQALNPKNAHVLLVEDSPDDQAIAGRALRTFGVRHIQVAETAEGAVQEVMRTPYDVALIDYNLPGMNGLQLLEQIKRVSPETRVIIVTGARKESVAVAAMKLGATDYISKDQFLTSGIVRSLQAALRARVDEAETEQRQVMASRTRELHEASIEGTWLLQALAERHGYRGDVRESLAEEWDGIVDLFKDYLRLSCTAFPEPATDVEDGLVRMLAQHGLSPRDVFRVYVSALREMIIEAPPGLDSVPIRPVLFLTHVLACLVEDLQTRVALPDFEAGHRDGVWTKP